MAQEDRNTTGLLPRLTADEQNLGVPASDRGSANNVSGAGESASVGRAAAAAAAATDMESHDTGAEFSNQRRGQDESAAPDAEVVFEGIGSPLLTPVACRSPTSPSPTSSPQMHDLKSPMLTTQVRGWSSPISSPPIRGWRSPFLSPRIHALRRGSTRDIRRPSVDSTGSAGSGHSQHSQRAESTFPIPHDLYSTNPDVPHWDWTGEKIETDEWDENDEGSNYEPWSSRMDSAVMSYLEDITNPPRDGMFNRVDPGATLRSHLGQADLATRETWERFLAFYDAAMLGKRGALRGLVGAHKRIYKERERAFTLELNLRQYEEDIEQLNKAVECQEQETWAQQKRVVDLESDIRSLTRGRNILEIQYKRLIALQGKQLGILEDLTAWLVPDRTAKMHLAAGDEQSLKDRFESVRTAVEEACNKVTMNKASYNQLQDKYHSLMNAVDEATQHPRSRGSSLPDAEPDPESKVMQLRLENQALKEELNAERARSVQKEHDHSQVIMSLADEREQRKAEIDRLEEDAAAYKEKCAALLETIDDNQAVMDELEVERARSVQKGHDHSQVMTNVVGEHKQQIGQKKAEIEQLKKEAAACKENCAALRGTIDELRQRLADEAADGKKEYKSSIDNSEDSVRDHVDVTFPGVMGGLRHKLAQLRIMQCSQGSTDEITAQIAKLIERVSTEIADARAIDFEDAKRILEDLRNLTSSAYSWTRSHKETEEGRGLILVELDALLRQIQSDQRTPQDVRLVGGQHAQVEAVKASFLQSVETEASSTALPPEKLSEGYENFTFGASDYEIKCLRAARHLVAQLRKRANDVGAEEAARWCIEQLLPLARGLRSTEPDTPAEDCILALGVFLEESVEKGAEGDPTDFYLTLGEHDRHLEALLELDRCGARPSERELELLEGIREGIQEVAALQRTQAGLVRDCRVDQHAQPPHTRSPGQSAKLLRLASSFIDAADRNRGRQTPSSRAGAAAVEILVARMLRITADPYLNERRRELQDGIERQEALLAELGKKLPLAMELVDSAKDQWDALRRIREKQQQVPVSEDGVNDDQMRQQWEASLKRRASRLRREHDFNVAWVDRLHAHRGKVLAFLNEQTAADRRRAESLLTETLLKLQISAREGHRVGDACFCTILRFLFPRVYYSHLDASDPPSPQSKTPKARTHGHSFPTLSGFRLWTPLCHILTSLTWLAFLVLIQPHNLLTTTISLSTLLFSNLPVYTYCILTYAISRVAHYFRYRFCNRIRVRRTPHPPPPRLPRLELLLNAPPPSTVVSSAITLFLIYAYLSYLAVRAERRIWLGANEWRMAYARDLTAAAAAAAATRSGGGSWGSGSGNNSWATGGAVAGGGIPPGPYPPWSPASVDFRLLRIGVHPLWRAFEEGVHWAFYGGGNLRDAGLGVWYGLALGFLKERGMVLVGSFKALGMGLLAFLQGLGVDLVGSLGRWVWFAGNAVEAVGGCIRGLVFGRGYALE